MRKFSIIYAYFVRTLLFFLPDIPFVMRFRGFLYGLVAAECGENFQVTHSTIFNSLSECRFGENVYFANNVVVLAGGGLKVASDVIIGPNTVISTSNHVFINNSWFNSERENRSVEIGKGAWVAANCTILSGSSLPSGSVLGAGSVLNKVLIEENSIYAGVPAKYIRNVRKI